MPAVPLVLDLTDEAAAELALVLSAVGIRHELRAAAAGTGVWVDEQDRSRAVAEWRRYAGENRRPAPPPAWPRHRHAVWGVAAYAVILMSVSAAALYGFADRNWVARGVLNAGLLERGEWWRAFTALTLHGDPGHLFANLVFGVLFAYPAAQFVGVGVAWLAILLGGGLAYALDVWLAPAGHSVLGASTAVFVALGLTSAFAWRRRAWAGLTRLQRAAPLVAGIALLAFTGAGGAHTDLLAHLLGFAVGALTGLALAQLPLPPPGNERFQRLAAAAAVAVLLVSWGTALA